MDEGGPSKAAALEADSGLDLLLPLYSFLQNPCQEAVYRFLITEFRDAQYIKENIDKCVKRDITVYNFFLHINQRFKVVKGRGKDSKSKPKRSPSSSQASCSKHQTHSPVCVPGGQQHPTHLNQYTNQPQEMAKDQHAAQCMEDLQSNLPSEIQNLCEKEKILVKVTVNNLLQRDEDACQVLQKLDLNFVLNIILNKHINFRLDKKLIEALYKMKKVRQSLVHAKYNFTENDFEENLTRLVEAVTVIYEALHLPEQLLLELSELCRLDAKSGNKVQDILSKLVSEAHPKYSLVEPNFADPNITLSEEVIEDLQKFIDGRQDNQDPIVLCGEQKREKTLVLERLAFRATSGSCPTFKLVLYLKDSHSRSCHPVAFVKDTKNAAQGFQDQVFACLANLVPFTVNKYGLDAVKAVIKTYQRYILFLLNWNVSVLGSVQSEMQLGTWIITFDGKKPSQVGWQVLRLEPYTEVQVEEILRHSPNSEDLLRCYHSFDSKEILSSMDMIEMFLEVSERISIGTDFEVVDKYVSRMVQRHGNEERRDEQDLLKLGKLAFNTLLTKKFVFPENNISDIQDWVRDCFLYCIEEERWSFKHSVVWDFLAARYVVLNSLVACETWIKRDENIVSFKRVFKFVCFMWFYDNSASKENLIYMETFLRKLLHVPDIKEAKHMEIEGKSGDRKSHQMEKKEALEDHSKHKNPFDSWGFLLELDEACVGKGEVLRRITSILSDIPCWRFNVDDSLDIGKLTRLQKLLKKVTLDKKDPLIIKLKSNTNITLLTELWKKLKVIERLYDCVNLMVTIEGDDASHLSYRNKLEDFLKTVADTQVPLYITRYKGPLFSSCIPSFLKCVCMHHLMILEVTVYDVGSLREVMACGALPSLEEVFIKVNLELTEQNYFKPASIEFPSKIPLHITFEYFPNIQQLLDSFKSRHRLSSLSIHGLYVFDGFRLNLSEFSNLKSINIRCDPKFSGDRSQILEKDEMEMEIGMNTLPRCHWALPLLNLSLPQKLERLLLRNVEFFNDSNQSFINKFFNQYSINRLLILDTQLSLTGVGKILCSQTEAEDDVNQRGGKRFRRNESHDMRKLAAKRIRISKERREEMKKSKPNGKEVVITSEGLLCADCSCFPCMCPSKVDRDGVQGHNSYERMVELINDMYCCNVQSFSYSFNQCTIRKDMCGDLRVECIMKCLTDTAALEIDSRSCLKRFFLPLMLAQCVTLEETALSPVGVAKVAEHLGHIRSSSKVDSFSLTIETSWHPPKYTSPFTGIQCFLKAADYLSVVHYRCGCTQKKCFHIKKNYKGEIVEVI